MKLCVTEPKFPEKIYCPKNWENGPKMGQKQVFLIYWKICALVFTEFDLERKLILFAVFLHKSYFWENCCF